MLSLKRKVGERIFIGKDIVLTVYQINPNSVRLAFDSPPEINIVREEIADAFLGDSTGSGIRDSAGLGGGLGVADAESE